MERLDMSLENDFFKVLGFIENGLDFVLKNVSQAEFEKGFYNEHGFYDLQSYLEMEMHSNVYNSRFYISGIGNRLKPHYDDYDKDEEDDFKGIYTVIYYPLKDKLIALKQKVQNL